MKMNRTNTASRLLALLLIALIALSLAACGAKGGDKTDGTSSEPKNAEEAVAMYNDLMAQENDILSENTELWEKVFMAADKGMTMQEDGKNYGDFLLSTIESAKDQFTADEMNLLQGEAEKIRDIENQLTLIEEKYPEAAQQSTDDAMSVPAGSDMTTPLDDGSMQKFPAFEGKDLDGNPVKSDELFSGNAVTVVNFWFTTCNPCVGELAELDALNKELAKKGGALIGVNTFTLDGDEKAIADLVGIYLTKEGFDVRIAYSGADAAKAILEQEFDLALLDVMLPDIDGFELLRTIRANHTYPVIMLTARDAQQDKIEGLSLGADDYVVKPFRPLELIARVHAQLRRYTSYGSRAQTAESPTLQLDGLEINRDARAVTVDGAPVRLTPIEYSILLYLVEHRGSVVPVEDLFRAVWNEDFMPGSNNTVMVHIRHLREKIGDDAQKPRFIKNVWGVGYIIE